jgi:hypothetical protein
MASLWLYLATINLLYCVPPALFALMIDHIGDQMLLEKAVGRLDDEEVEVSRISCNE